MSLVSKTSELGLKTKKKNKLTFTFLMLFLLLLSIYITTSILAPIKKLDSLKQKNERLSIQDSSAYLLFEKVPKLDSLAKEEAFLKSRLSMTESDSIGIVLDLSDSTIRLELHGVTIHCAEIQKYKTDRFFNSMDKQSYLTMFSAPFSTVMQTSSIEKEPLTVKRAPKDSIEAAKSVYMPDTNIKPSMFCSLDLDSGIRIYLFQDSLSGKKDWFEKNRFILRDKIAIFFNNCYSLLHFQIPEYKPEIVLYLSQKDAVAIYRAIPANALVCVRL